MNKKYLIYDNLVRGSGVGHFLLSYNFGLDYSIKNKLEYLPTVGALGHNLGGRRGFVESSLGLPNFQDRRAEVLSNDPESCEIIHYQSSRDEPPPTSGRFTGFNPTSGDFTLTKEYFRHRYFNYATNTPTLLKENKVNICATVRRGDLLFNPKLHKDRLRSSSDLFFKKTINKYIPNHPNYHISIFSDGDCASNDYIDDKGSRHKFEGMCNLLNLDQTKTSYHTTYDKDCHETIFSDFRSCVMSDIFIGSYSSFSVLVSLYRSNISILPSTLGPFGGPTSYYSNIDDIALEEI